MQLTKKCPKYTYRKDGAYYFSNALSKGLLDPCLIRSGHQLNQRHAQGPLFFLFVCPPSWQQQ